MFQFIKDLFSNKKLKDAEDEIFSLKEECGRLNFRNEALKNSLDLNELALIESNRG